VGDGLADHLAGAILDGRPIDWASAESSDDLDGRSLVPYLQTVARIADLYRSVGATRSMPSPEPRDAEHGVPRTGAIPTEWGHLRILERIGRGGFGDVYRAWDSKLDREVALKLLLERDALSDQGSAIIEEGRLLARVHHRNVVTIYGADRLDGRVGLWMELIRGETLQQAVERGRSFDTSDAIRIGIELAGAMSAVHDAGLLHRDIKPHNVMLADDGRVVLMDFGAGHDARTDGRPRLSGTPLYLAPELLCGAAPSVSSDIYSLGVVLFFLLTRTYPVRGQSLSDLQRAHEAGEVADVRTLRPDVSRRLARVIMRAIQPLGSRRQPTAAALAAELAALSRRIQPRPMWYAAATAALVVSLGIGWTLRPSSDSSGGVISPTPIPPAPSVAQRPVIAVLPLQNLSTEPGSDELTDGLTDEIIRNLAVIDGLEVRSRTSSFSFKGKPRNLAEVGGQLRANLVVEGSVLRAGIRIRINAQLVEVSGDKPLWSERFDRDVADILSIQDDISRAIVNQLRLTLGRGQRRYNTRHEIYEVYLRAQALSQRRGTAGARQAAELFRQVLDRDTAFAPAYAGLANAYAFMSFGYTGLENEEGLAQMRPAAERALEHDPLLAEAHAAMGLLHSRERRWQDAARSFDRALQLNPSLTSTHTNYVSSTLLPLGRVDEAHRVMAAALRADPLSLDVQRYAAIVAIVRGEYDNAIVTLRKIYATDPAFTFVDQHLGRALTLAGRIDEAMLVWAGREKRAQAQQLDIRGIQYWSALAYVRAGRRAEVERWPIGQDRFPYRQALIYAALDDKDSAFDALTRAIDTEPQRVAGVLIVPELAGLRDDPRYGTLRARLNLPPLEPRRPPDRQ
jgi:TolB-like protein/Tfp pilus assembly protein PilF